MQKTNKVGSGASKGTRAAAHTTQSALSQVAERITYIFSESRSLNAPASFLLPLRQDWSLTRFYPD